ncbi:MAG: bifunctional oligoribonuclease/PAP phosphatase NrnA [Peptococcaceae bacterium]|nr:bifunctional oligoribonuclease/PAP phosphatase NrnA [Peptococcaceae bacterium]
MNSLAEIGGVLRRAGSILICGHVTPDGDSLGSVLALGLTMEMLGKKVTMAGPDPVPALYGFLPAAERFLAGAPPEGNYDTLVVLDCSVPERLGRGYQDLLTREMVVVNIDHHAGFRSFGTYRYIDPLAAATGEILFDLFKLMRLDISPDAAVCLYTAIITDTGSFQYDNTTPGTHRRVAELIELGVPAAEVNTRIYEEKPREVLLLLGAALNTMSMSPCGKVCWMTVSRAMLGNTGAADEHTEGLVNYARSVRGVEVALLFRELEDGKYKVSFRSKGAVDVNRLAALFGGGGHRRAAGSIMHGDLAQIREEVVAAAVLAAGGDRQ